MKNGMEVLIIKFFILNVLFTYVMSVGRQEGFGIFLCFVELHGRSYKRVMGS
jgi:hypothetical protein